MLLSLHKYLMDVVFGKAGGGRLGQGLSLSQGRWKPVGRAERGCQGLGRRALHSLPSQSTEKALKKKQKNRKEGKKNGRRKTNKLLGGLIPPLISFSVLFRLSALLSVSFLCSPLSLPLPSFFSYLYLIFLSLLKPKCCCEGREPWKSEWPPPLAGQSRGRGEPWRAVLLDTPRRGRQSLGRHPGPQRSFSFVSLLPPGK